MKRLALWSVRHRRIVVIGWLVVVAALIGISKSAGTAFDDSLSLPGTESQQALQLLQANAPAQAGDSEQVVVASSGGSKLTDTAVRAQAEALFAKLATIHGVSGVVSPFSPAGVAQINQDATVAFAMLQYAQPVDRLTSTDAKALVEMARSFRSAQLDVAVQGPVAMKASAGELGGVGLGILAAGVVLFLVFGSLLAALLPLVATVLALPAASAAVGLLSHAIAIPTASVQVMTLIALGVGIDYALFIVTRTRQALQAGKSVESAIVTAVTTSGRAVLFAGAVVCVALLGLTSLGIGLVSGFGIGGSVGVLFTMAAAVTLLPALLGFFGTKTLSRRERRALAAGDTTAAETGPWWTWSRFVSRRPIVPAVIALGVVAALAIPVFSMRLGTSDNGNGTPELTTRQAYDMLARGFGPGFNGPLQMTVQAGGGDTDRVAALTTAISHDDGVAAVSPSRVLSTHGDEQVLTVTIYPVGAPQEASTSQLVHRLRTSVVPTALQGSSVVAHIGGATATADDFTAVLTSKMPLFVTLVLVLSFLLLTVVFRSIVISLTAVVMNLFSSAATFGVLTAAYVWGWGGQLLGGDRPGPIEGPMPVMIFAILFGLSMDYQVFLVARIQEEWHRVRDNKVAVTRGLAITGRTITAAAVIMIVVFGSFILGGERLLKEFGLGLATAVFVDAFLIRIAIVPAVMFVAGRANWWLPKRLATVLPELTHGSDHLSATTPAKELVGAASEVGR